MGKFTLFIIRVNQISSRYYQKWLTSLILDKKVFNVGKVRFSALVDRYFSISWISFAIQPCNDLCTSTFSTSQLDCGDTSFSSFVLYLRDTRVRREEMRRWKSRCSYSRSSSISDNNERWTLEQRRSYWQTHACITWRFPLPSDPIGEIPFLLIYIYLYICIYRHIHNHKKKIPTGPVPRIMG